MGTLLPRLAAVRAHTLSCARAAAFSASVSPIHAVHGIANTIQYVVANPSKESSAIHAIRKLRESGNALNLAT
jgi:hypothetical protein